MTNFSPVKNLKLQIIHPKTSTIKRKLQVDQVISVPEGRRASGGAESVAQVILRAKPVT